MSPPLDEVLADMTAAARAAADLTFRQHRRFRDIAVGPRDRPTPCPTPTASPSS